MSIWGRFSSFIANLEKNIDEDFESRENASITVQSNTEMDIPEEILEKIDEKEDKEEKENIKELKTEEEEEINEIEKKKEIIEKIKKIEEDLELQQAELIKHQTVIDEIGPPGASLIDEFSTRQAKLKTIYDKIVQNEEDLKKDLEEAEKADEILESAKSEHDEAKELLKNTKSKYDELKMIKESLDNEEKQLLSSINDLEETMESLQEEKSNLEKETKEANAKLAETKKSISKSEDLIEELKKEGSKSKINFDEANDEKKTFDNKIEALKTQKEQILNELNTIDSLRQQRAEERRFAKAAAMKTLTAESIKKMEQERKDLIEERENLINEKTNRVSEREKEISDLEEQLTAAEIQEHELRIHLEDSKQSAPRLLIPLEARLETLKSVFDTNEKAYRETNGRLKKELLEAEIKKEKVQSECITKNEEYERAKDALDAIKQKTNKQKEEIIKTEQKLNEVNANIERIKGKSFSSEGELQGMRADLAMNLSEQKRMEDRLERTKIMNQEKIKELNEQMDQYKRIIEAAKTPTPFAMWRQLTEKSAAIDKESDDLIKVINDNAESTLKFDGVLDIIAEKQENIDHLKKIIKREKECFQENLKKIFGD